MKAMRYHSYGDSHVLVYEDADRPVAGAGQVVVQVAGTSFNPADALIRAGYLAEVFPVAFPHVPGIDVAGTIAELGDGVEGWHVGYAVVAFLPMAADGGYAVQLAKQAGGVVTATAGARSVDRLRGYGADRLIGYLDYTTASVT